MSQAQYHFLIIACILQLQLACTPSSVTVRNSKGASQSSNSEESKSSSNINTSSGVPKVIEGEDDALMPPTQISGVYLHCLIEDKELAALGQAQLNCLVKDSKEATKASLPTLYSAASFTYQRPEDSAINVAAALSPEASPYHVNFQFSATAGSTLSRTVLEQFLVMFQATPLQDTRGARFFSAKLGKDGAASQLPEEFPIYYGQGTVVNQPAQGFVRRILPTVNRSYSPVDGCYLACYSMQERGSVYPIGGSNVFVMGQFRSKGLYEGRLCRPDGIGADVNLADDQKLKKLCTQFIPACAGDICWAGNDTGGWYGL